MATLLIITENNPNVHQQVNGWYIYTIEYYSARKRSKLLTDTRTWMNPKTMILNERS